MSQKQAIETFVIVVDGLEQTIEKGDLRDSTDPVVTDRPELWEDPTSGGSTPGAAIIHGPFPLAHNTPNLDAGIDFYTPVDGELLLDVLFVIDTAWNGTTPMGDVYGGKGPTNLFATAVNFFGGTGAVDMTQASAGGGYGQGVTSLVAANAVAAVFDLLGTDSIASVPTTGPTYFAPFVYAPAPSLGNGDTAVPIPLIAANPLQVVVSRDGTAGGGDPGSTTGAGRLYVVTAVPAAFS